MKRELIARSLLFVASLSSMVFLIVGYAAAGVIAGGYLVVVAFVAINLVLLLAIRHDFKSARIGYAVAALSLVHFATDVGPVAATALFLLSCGPLLGVMLYFRRG